MGRIATSFPSRNSDWTTIPISGCWRNRHRSPDTASLQLQWSFFFP